MIEREGHKFFINLTYEKLPDFCRNCLAVGHSLINYKKNNIKKPTTGNSLQQTTKAQASKTVSCKKSTMAAQPTIPEAVSIHENPLAELSRPRDDDNANPTPPRKVLDIIPFDKINDNDAIPEEQPNAATNTRNQDLENSTNSAVLATTSGPHNDITQEQQISVMNTSGLNLTVELNKDTLAMDSIVSSIVPSVSASKDLNVVTSNSWADLADEEDSTVNAGKKQGKKIAKPTPSMRTRRGHVPNPSL